jgi:hypothetical protein
VRPGSGGLLAQRVALLDAEPVLLVDDHQAKVGELNLVLKQRVGADEDAGVAGEHVAERAAPRPHARRAGEQRYPGRLLPRTELPGPELASGAEWTEQRGDRAVVLLREHLGRREQRGLPARVHHLEHRPDRDDGLAGPDLALEQPVHRVGAGQVVRDDLAHRPLPLGEAERQPPVERGGDPVLGRRAGHRGHGKGGVPPLGERGLHGERLVPLEPLARLPQVIAVGRPVDGPDGQFPRPQVMLRADLGRQRVLARVQRLQDRVDVPGDRPRGQLGARRVDGDQLRGELLGQLRGQPLVSGRDREQLILRLHQLAAAAKARHRAGEQGERALRQLLGVESDAGEERELQLARAVGDDDLKPLLRTTAGRRLRPLTGNVRPDDATVATRASTVTWSPSASESSGVSSPLV